MAFNLRLMLSIFLWKTYTIESVFNEVLDTFQLSKGEDSINEGATLTV